MSHFLSAERAREKDFLAIGRILDLDPRGLYDVVRREGISMCGYQPTVAAMVAAVGLGASRAELVVYLTSGEASGDWFGVSVALDGEVLVVGADSEDSVGVDAGAAYVFERDHRRTPVVFFWG